MHTLCSLTTAALVITVIYSFTLNVYHTNDIHARYDQRGPSEGGKCRETDGSKSCYGGMPRHAGFFKKHVDTSANNLIVSGGDWFTGTTYFSVYEGNLTAHYLNTLGYDAWAFGNHEFDKGPETLARTVDMVKGPSTLAANIHPKSSSPLSGKFKSSMIKEFTSSTGVVTKVGVIGYITPETSFLSNPGPDIRFTDPVEAVREEAELLKEQDVDIVVAIGHAGIETDQLLCAMIPELDIAVGGHTNTFLWNGELPAGATVDETIYGKYPLTFRGGACLAVQDFAYGKFIGNLSVEFNSAGEVQGYSGNPVLMWGDAFPEDPETLEELKGFSKEVERYSKVVVGYTDRLIDGTRQSCRTKECELGNLIADAFLDSYRKYDNEVVCCIINSGSIRASIDKGDITYEDVLTVMPFGNTVDRTTITGSALKEAFEHSVSTFDKNGVNIGEQGRYIQVAGMNVHYDLSKKLHDRVSKLLIQDENGVFAPVEPAKEYDCVGASYLLAGGDGFSMFANLTRVSGDSDVAVMESFLREYNPLDTYPSLQDIPSRSFMVDSAAPSLASSSLLIALLLQFSFPV